MSDQHNPGSLDISMNEGSKSSQTPKDKACPFCQQQFTSSSLGRHLDLYIKERNPKPADGVHDIDEIRKLRGGITRRQPRNSTSKRELSILSTGTSGPIERRSPRIGGEREKNQSLSSRRGEGPSGYSHPNQHENKSKASGFINRATWESTGVINNIPTPWNSDGRAWDGEEKDHGRRIEARGRSVNRKILAKASYEQRQKLVEAVDNAKAAGLALRELVGSIRAARQYIQGAQVLSFDPISMDFPSLCLHCLPPPPTLKTNTIIPSPNSWALTPPEDSQYQALGSYFTTAFHRYRVSLATNTAKQDQSYSNQGQGPAPCDPRATAARLETAANTLECKVRNHLQAVFQAWQALPPANRAEIWTISLARSIESKNFQIEKLKTEIEACKHEATQLKQQLKDVTNKQYPREFRISQPRMVKIGSDSVAVLGDWATGASGEGKTEGGNLNSDHSSGGVGLNILDNNVPIESAVERTLERWRTIVKEARKQQAVLDETALPERSIPGQQKMNRDSMGTGEILQSPSIQVPPNQWERPRETNKNGPSHNVGVGSDADADADMEEDEDGSIVEMVDAPSVLRTSLNHPIFFQPQHAHHFQQQQVRDQGFRLSHDNQAKTSSNVGPDPNHNINNNQNMVANDNHISNANLSSSNNHNNNSNRGMEGLDNQIVGGY